MVRSELLVKYGFIKKDKKEYYSLNEEKKVYEPVESYTFSESDADEEEREANYGGEYDKTGFPKPLKSYKVSMEVYDLSLEGPYYWVLEDLQQKFTIIEKLEDSFAAAEHSAFFGVTQQRLGAQQDKVSQFLATTGKMIKELFQMVRELRILDERLEYYEEAEMQLEKDLDKRGKSAEITLKGLFVDLVQGGGKSAASIYGMARELEFITLPDLFFDAPPFKSADEMEKYADGLGKDFNQNVVRVLKRHFRHFMEWKKRTHQEHKSRKGFMRQYLLQHYEIIRMYITWVKPYLKNVARMSMKEGSVSKADLISAFESSLLDIEILARKHEKVGNSGANGCVLATFNYRTRPEMKVVQEGYQRGPVHIGKVELNLRNYFWTDEQVKNYKTLKEKETFELMGDISESVKKAMEALGDELNKYLEEAKQEKDKKKVESKIKEEKKSVMEKLFGDFYTPSRNKKGKPKAAGANKETKEIEAKIKSHEDALKGYINTNTFLTFKNFKKAHGMVMW